MKGQATKAPCPIVLAPALGVKKRQESASPKADKLTQHRKGSEVQSGAARERKQHTQSEKPAAKADSDFSIKSLRGD